MAESEGVFRLTFVEGRGLLSLAGRDFEGLGRVERLELELPNLLFPFDLSGGVARFKNRRLRLRELALSVGARDLTGLLARARLADFGIFDPHVVILGTGLTLCARVLLGGREAELTASAEISPHAPRGVRLCVHDVRAHGFLPVPAPLLVTALFTALGAASPSTPDRVQAGALAPLLRIEGPSDIVIDVCDLAMLAILPMHGWRLPERSQVRICSVGGGVHSARLPLVFGQPGGAPMGDGAGDRSEIHEVVQTRAFAKRAAPIEEALVRGDLASALGQLRALAPLDADDRVGTARLLALLQAGANTLGEAGDLAEAALLRWPNFVPGLLTRAVVATELGKIPLAAETYEQVAKLSTEDGRQVEAGCAWFAAARLWAGHTELSRALVSMDRSLACRAYLRPVDRAKAGKLARDGQWSEILARMGEDGVLAGVGEQDEVAQVLDLVELGDLSQDMQLVAQAGQALEALLGRETWPSAVFSRAEAAYQMGLVQLSLGKDEAASHWFATSIEGDAPGVILDAAWRELTGLLQRRGEAAGLAQALAGWAVDARTSQSAAQRTGRLLDASLITLRDLGRVEDAASFLESALGFAPAEASILAALEALGDQSGHWERVLEILRRHLSEIRPEEGKPLLRLLGRLLVEKTDRHSEALSIYQLLFELCPGDDEVAYYLARLKWVGGGREGSVAGFERASRSHALAPAQVAEAHLRLEQMAQAGAQHGANPEGVQGHLAQGLAEEPEGARVEVLVQALRELGREPLLSVLLARREAALPEGKERQATRRAMAMLAEDMGDLVSAEAAYNTFLEANPDDREIALRMASLCRRQGRASELVHWLDRLWTLVEGEPVTATGLVDRTALGTELAGLLCREPSEKARAEKILRRLREISPATAAVLDPLGILLAERGAFDEAAKVFSQLLQITPEQGVSILLLSRARLCAVQPEGLRPALALAQSVDVEKLQSEALALRADFAELAGDLGDAVRCLQQLQMVAPEEERAPLARRILGLAARPEIPVEAAISVLEKLAAQAPDDLHLAQTLFDAFGRLEDLWGRISSWQGLLERTPALPDSCRARLQVALSEMAEREGDLQTAEDRLNQAMTLDTSPEALGRQLVLHARLLVARGELTQAANDLDQALALSPDLVGALALAGDLAYRAQAWVKAREIYTRLAQVPGASDSDSAVTFALRRAELAEIFSDPVQAEAGYREVLALDPHNTRALAALAGFASLHGDLSQAVLHLQEVLRVLPADAGDQRTQLRERLGQVYLDQGDLSAARQNLELALASEPDRWETLNLLTTAYERLGLHREAAATCEHQSRILADPAKKAAALFRKGEILRAALGDEESANDAYLRASDLDPSLGPTLGRLASYYWDHGEWKELAAVGTDLLRASPVLKDQDDVGLLVAVAALLVRNDESLAKAAIASPALGAPLRAEAAATRFGELASKVAGGNPNGFDSALKLVLDAGPPDFEGALHAVAWQRVSQDAADAGQVYLLARIFDLRGRVALARAAYSLAHFADPAMGADGRLRVLGEVNNARADALATDAAAHVLCRGPLRKVLRAMATALAMAEPVGEVPSAGDPLQGESLALCEELRSRLGAPPVPFVRVGEGAEVSFAASAPLRITLGRRAEAREPTDLRFWVARALEQARAGTLVAVRMSPENLLGFLQAVLYVAGADGASSTMAEDPTHAATALWLDRLRQPDTASLLPVGTGKDQLAAEAALALASPPELGPYIRGCRFTADRIGLLACGNSLVALSALAGTLKAEIPAGEADAMVVRRREQLRSSPALRELVAFMLSEEYAALVES